MLSNKTDSQWGVKYNNREYGRAMLSKFPRFWQIDPEIWFVQVDAFFNIHCISNDMGKFLVLVSNVEHSLLPYIADIVRSPPNQDKYSAIKERILSVFAKSEEVRLRELIHDQLHMVDRPSQLLNAMYITSGDRASDQVIKRMFIERVSGTYRGRFNESQSLDEIGQIADMIVDSAEMSMAQFWDYLTSDLEKIAELISPIVRRM